jgi:hypothetical protein
MTKRYKYKIFPTSTRGRVLLALAFGLGGLMMIGYIVFFVFLQFGNFFDEQEVTYVNQTDETVTIYIDDVTELTVGPGESVTEEYFRLEWWFGRTVSARDPAGNVVWAEKLDEDDLEDTDWRIVVSE